MRRGLYNGRRNSNCWVVALYLSPTLISFSFTFKKFTHTIFGKMTFKATTIFWNVVWCLVVLPSWGHQQQNTLEAYQHLQPLAFFVWIINAYRCLLRLALNARGGKEDRWGSTKTFGRFRRPVKLSRWKQNPPENTQKTSTSTATSC